MEEPQQRGPAVREVPYPDDVAAIARRLESAPAWCWLDGGFGDDADWSYLAIASEVRTAARGGEQRFLEDLRAAASVSSAPVEPSAFSASSAADLTGFTGGWVAALGYEFGVALLGLDPAEDDAEPAFALRIETVLAIHHATRRAELRGTDAASLDRWWVRFGAELPSSELGEVSTGQRSWASDLPRAKPTAAHWRQSDASYAAQASACQRKIVDGESYVLCLTDTAELEGVSTPPLDLFLRLRGRGGAIRGAVIVAGDRALVSASPERFLSVQDRTVSTHPIKGTRPRSADPAADARLAADLAADPKERAENLMIVDLMRNDLSRVCEPGSVGVDGFLRVESHPHVHQLVSTVSGQLRAGLDAVDAIAAAFPGGSMTGAPKRRAVEILGALEGGPRGLYSGCFGWVDARGDLELAMTIRSIELRGLRGPAADRSARVGAGGGVTADSDPESELREKHLKAAPLLAALRGADPSSE
ncbi:anthranilate synthase component I family protein [Leucobacter rhizosphaerae]|uniref:Anthranilate synthase component I family protein n=1 Tax=Leucobacter rhizosphaerae TaxID=2932245 RepID=A0ABY4FX88_9MICO|nr:anthranilate synthase component I family protein [Leucobacter rhizosphaerae]UOQ60774.1 anthranilate synthase component I family protein [Leucobacter rhizosphaerae]